MAGGIACFRVVIWPSIHPIILNAISEEHHEGISLNLVQIFNVT